MDNQQATEAELGWLAGIIDGEGTITIQRRMRKNKYPEYEPRICITNTDTDIIFKCDELFRKLGISPYHQVPNDGKHNKLPIYEIRITRLAYIKILLDYMVSYLVGKKSQAKLVLQHVNSRLNLVNKKDTNWQERDNVYRQLIQYHNKGKRIYLPLNEESSETNEQSILGNEDNDIVRSHDESVS